MTDTNQGVGDSQANGGAEDQNQQSSNQGDQQEKGPVDWEDHQRALNDMHKFKSRTRELEEKLNQTLSTVDELKQKGLREKEDYKALYENTQSKLEEALSAKDRMKQNVFTSERHRAIYPALKKAGLRDDAENLIDVTDWSDHLDVEVTSAGRFNVSGVDSAVEIFKNRYPFAFEAKRAPRVNGATGDNNPPSDEKLTPQKLIEIEDRCRKKGDMTEYHQAYRKYREQKAAN